MPAAVRSRGRQSARRRPHGGAGRERRPARDRLLRAAAELAPQCGYELLQVGEIAAAAGVSRQTFYAHFADKRQCVSEACEPRIVPVERHLREANEDGLDWAGPLLRALDETLARRFSTPSSKRDVLMEAMSEMVARQGFTSVRLSAVIEEAGLTQRGFYNHFAGKEQCFATAVARLLERLERESRGSLEMLIERLAGDPCAARILLVEIHSLPEPSGDDRTGPRSFVALIERLLSAGEDAQETSGRAQGKRSRRLAVGALIETLRTDALQGRPGAMLAHVAQWRELLFRAEPCEPVA